MGHLLLRRRLLPAGGRGAHDAASPRVQRRTDLVPLREAGVCVCMRMCILLTTYYLLPRVLLTTHYSLLTTHYSLLTTHHSPLTTHYSPLTTHHSPLTTHHSPRVLTALHYSPQSVGSELASLVSSALGVVSPTKPKLGVVSPVSLPTCTGTGASEEGRGDETRGVHLGVISPKRCTPSTQHTAAPAARLQHACNTPCTHAQPCTPLSTPARLGTVAGSRMRRATRRATHTRLHRRRRAA